MFRKKQTTKRKFREVRPQQAANVFSYYANRSPGESSRGARTEVAASKRSERGIGRRWITYIPSFAAGLILLSCAIYVSTLEDNPKLQMVGGQRHTSLVSGMGVYEDGVREVLKSSIINRSKLLINTDDVAAKIRDKYPELGEVAVILPLIERRPIVQVYPSEPALVLGTLEGGIVVNENGRAIAYARDVESSVRDTLPVVQDESGLSLEPGKYAVPKETVEFVRVVAYQLKQKSFKIKTMVLPATASEMHVRLEGKPYYIKFNLRGEGRTQTGTFIALNKKLEADKVTPREYVDVRVPGKAYYR